MKKTLLSVVLIAFFGAVVIGAVYYGTVSNPSVAAAPAPAVKVALAPVTKAEMSRYFNAVGELESVRQVQVASEIGGRITQILFESGQVVKAGQILVKLNDAPEQAAMIRLQGQLRNAQIVLVRTRNLVDKKAAAQEQLDRALADRDSALGAVRETQSVIDQKTIRAPFTGVLGIRQVQLGQFLTPGSGIANLIDNRTMYANFALDEQAGAELQLGQTVQLAVEGYRKGEIQAQITAIDPLVNRSRMVQVQATLRNPDGALRAGMYAGIRVLRPQQASVLTVPETTVIATAYGDTVYLARREAAQPAFTVKRVAVKVGERQDGRIEIASGLKEGDLVVTSGQIKLSDGMAVAAASQDTLQAQDATASLRAEGGAGAP